MVYLDQLWLFASVSTAQYPILPQEKKKKKKIRSSVQDFFNAYVNISTKTTRHLLCSNIKWIRVYLQKKEILLLTLVWFSLDKALFTWIGTIASVLISGCIYSSVLLVSEVWLTNQETFKQSLLYYRCKYSIIKASLNK